MRTNLSGAVAAVIVALEGIGVGALAIREIIAMIAGDTAAIDSAIALLVLTVVGAIALIAFAVAIWRGQSWGRSGGIVAQEAPIHVSNVMVVDSDGKPTRVGYRTDEEGKRVRVSRRTGKDL